MADTQPAQDDDPGRFGIVHLDSDAHDAWQRSVDATSPGIASLVGKTDDKNVFSGFAGLAKEKAAEDTAITRASDKRMAQDQARMDAMFRAEGASAAELPRPWNADEMHARYETNPIEGFGSIGGIFAVIASAFTKAPMENAINGMAGAINSIKQGNEAAYERAYTAWKDNTQLALQRFKTQHELYQDATALFDHDAAAAEAKLHNAAVRFGDKQMQMLLDHGLWKEGFELIQSRAKTADMLQDLADRTEERDIRKAAIKARLADVQPTGDKNKDALIKSTITLQMLHPEKMQSAEQEAVGRFLQDAIKKNKSTDEIVDGLIDIHQRASVRGPNVEGYQTAKQNWRTQHPGETISPEEDAKLLQEFGLTGIGRGAAGTLGAQREADKKENAKEISKAIISGHQPPTTTGLYGAGPEVKADLEREGFDLAKAQLEWSAAQKQVQSLNGPQMTRFVGLAQSVDNTIDEAVRLAKEMDNIGITKINKLKLEALVNYEGNTERGRLATRYLTTVNTLKEEFANLANGGYAPTEPAWKLANEQINANYGVNQLTDSLGEVQRLIRYRINAIPGLRAIGPGSPNQYMPTGGQAASTAGLPEQARRELKEGVITTFKNGQKWTLHNGVPEQVP